MYLKIVRIENQHGEWPYPGLVIPNNLSFLEDYFDIQPKEGVEDPVYPTDYLFKQKIEIKDGSNQYLLSEITNNVNTVEQFQTDDIIFDIDKSDNTLSCVMSLPGSRREDTNPKLYSNMVGSVFSDSLLKVGVANINDIGQYSPEDFGDYWFIREINVNIPTPTSSQKTLTLTQNTITPQTIYPPAGEYWNSIQYSVNVTPFFNITKARASNTTSYLTGITQLTANQQYTIYQGQESFFVEKRGSSWTVLYVRDAGSQFNWNVSSDATKAYAWRGQITSSGNAVEFLANINGQLNKVMTLSDDVGGDNGQNRIYLHSNYFDFNF